ncbi:aminotransferase class I/II-fold pyridoxal phosphate-dependent enzyme, partial [bacterium]|nr:aminotransferase class I/II-fold pyridoxal phosphate-dependent enzyme [bacterium]
MKIPFNSASLTKKELEYITEVLRSGKISGNGIFSKKCTEFIQNNFGIKQAFLTTSGTAALEAIALLLDLEQGDEVIMPSFTYPSTANAFLLRGAVPRFCDIRNDTLNLDENLIEALINENTKALVPVHYAGTACEMDTICALTKQYKLALVEDAAHGIGGRYKDRFLGSMGDMAAFSFHETKNIISGEG